MSLRLFQLVAMWLSVTSFLPFTAPFQTWSAVRVSVDFDLSLSSPHDDSLKLPTPILPATHLVSAEPVFGRLLQYLPQRINGHSPPPIVLRV